MKWLNRHKKWARVIIIAVFIIIAIVNRDIFSAENIADFAPASIPAAVIIFFAAYALKAYTIIFPLMALYAAAGLVFPTVWAILISYIGLIIAAGICYISGKKLGEYKVNQLLEKNKKAANLLNKHKSRLFFLCLVSRASPLPFDLCSIFFGAVNMPLWQYILATAGLQLLFLQAL